MSKLVSKIDQALAFVEQHPQAMTEEELDHFRAIADDIYLSSLPLGFAIALPQVPNLIPQLDAPRIGPCQFESKLNLPGDWDTIDGERVFLPVASPRWIEDMQTLRTLAETNKEKSGKQAKQVPLDARAVAVFVENPELTKKAIAKRLGCPPQSLAPKRCPKLTSAMKAFRVPDLAHGSKDKDGRLEAWDTD